MFKKFSLISLILLSSGCSFLANEEKPAPSTAQLPVKLDLYISRASLRLNEFEQYKYLGTKLFWECGEIRGGRPTAKQQQLIDIPAAVQSRVNEKAQSLFDKVVAIPELNLDPPGTTGDMFDPGRAIATIQVGDRKVDVKTSFDAVQQGTKETTADLLYIAKALRSATGGTPCGNPQFYGLTSE